MREAEDEADLFDKPKKHIQVEEKLAETTPAKKESKEAKPEKSKAPSGFY